VAKRSGTTTTEHHTKPSPYITREGYRCLSEELRYLWKEKRPEVTRRVSEAAAMGDRSENAEYIYGKRQLREIDRRIRFLSKRLDELTVVERVPPDRTRIFFGAWVTLADDESQARLYRIVGPDEFDRAPGYVSIDAPLARALLKKSAGDDVEVTAPDGRRHYRIVAVTYEPPDDSPA
jgi:transcription elongation factor GreB